MMGTSFALAIICLTAQQPVTSSGGAVPAAAPHDAAQAASPSGTATEMLLGRKVKFELLDAKGVEHTASLVRVDGTNAVLRSHGADHSIPVDQLRRFERPGDRRWDGALIGFGVGAALGTLVALGEATASIFNDGPDAPDAHSTAHVVSLICISTALGYAIDAAHGGKHTLFVGTMPVTPAPQAASPSEAATEVLQGRQVKFELVDSRGVEHNASLVRIDGNNAVLRSRGADYSIPADRLQRFERRGDRRWDGALIGLAVGVGVTALASGFVPITGDDGTTARTVAVLCASTAAGYAIDAARGGTRTLFVGTMPATPATHTSALAVGLLGHAHNRGLQASYRVMF